MYNPRLMAFIDGSNFFQTLKLLPNQPKFDFQQFAKYLDKHFNVVRLNYYTALLPNPQTGEDKLRPLLDYLAYNQYNIITKPGKQWIDSDGDAIKKGNMDLDMAVNMLTHTDSVEIVLLATGDSDFIPVVRELQRRGKRVTLLSSLQTTRNILADDLRKCADVFTDIVDLMEAMKNGT